MIFTASEIVHKAITTANLQNADFSYETVVHFLEIAYKALLTDYQNKVAGEYGVVTSPLTDPCAVDNMRLYKLPSNMWHLRRVFTHTGIGNEQDLLEVPESYGSPTGFHYRIGDRGLYTGTHFDRLYVSYDPVPVTPTFRMKPLPIDCDIGTQTAAYDGENDMVIAIKNGELNDGSGISASNVFGGHGRMFYANELGVRDLNTGAQVLVNTDVVPISDSDRYTYDWRTDTVYRGDVMDLGGAFAYYDAPNYRLMVDTTEYTPCYGWTIIGCAFNYPYVYITKRVDNFKRVFVANMVTDKVTELAYPVRKSEIVTGADVADKHGYGTLSEIQGRICLTGCFPDTVFDHDQSVFFDVLVPRLASLLQAYVGGTLNLEIEAERQTKRTRMPNRIRNVRRSY